MMNAWLSRYTKLLVSVTFLLVIAGGLVTSTRSGLAVPDWPLSYGKLMPPMVGGIRFEHSHRVVASLVGFMTLILTFWIGFTERRPWIRWAGITALGMIVAQGILGGLTVLYLLPAPISITHGCLAQTFFAFVICLAYFTSSEWQKGFPVALIDLTILKRILFLTVTLIYLQLILGATFRHTGNQFVLIPHVVGAFLVLIHGGLVLMFVLRNLAAEKKFVWPAIFLSTIALLQISLGMGAFIYSVMLKDSEMGPGLGKVFFVTAHQTLGALLLGTAVFFALRVYRIEKILGQHAKA